MSAIGERIVRLLRARFIWSVGAQGAVSAFHFALNLALLRLVTPYEYGSFAFAFVLALFASAINNALISTPLTVYTPVIADERERRRAEALFGTLNLALFGVLLAVGLGWTWFASGGGTAPAASSVGAIAGAGLDQRAVSVRDIALGATVFVALYAARQYSRTTGYARLKPLIPAAGDIAYVVGGVTLVGGLLWRGHLAGTGPAIGQVLLALGAANALAMGVEQTLLHRRWPTLAVRTTRDGDAIRLADYAPVWQQTRWALLGALTTLALAQAHGVVVTSRAGPDAFAPLAAGFVLFGPVRIALLTWQNMVKPELAIALDQGQAENVRVQLRRITRNTVLALAVIAAALALAWPWLHAALYASRYADAPMAKIVALCAVITLFAASYNAPSAALQALREFKRLALASVVGAVLGNALVLWLLVRFDAVHTLYGVLVAEAFMAVWLMRMLGSRLDRLGNGATTAAPVPGATSADASAPQPDDESPIRHRDEPDAARGHG